MAEALKPTYLLLGPEEGQKSEFIESLRVQLRTAHPNLVEEYKYRADDKTVSDLLSLIQNGSLFSEALFVLYADVDLLRKEDVKTLAAYIRDPNPNCLLVLTSLAIKVDELLLGAIPKDGQKIFYELFESQRRGWLINYFRNQGCPLSEDAADFFIEMVGNTTDQLRAEADRVLLFVEKGTTLNLQFLEEYLQHQREESPFTLFHALLERRLDASLEILDKISLSGEGQLTGLMILLTRQWRTFYQYISMREKGAPEDTCFQNLKIFVRRQKDSYKKASQSFSVHDCERIYRLTQEFDLAVRQAGATEKKVYLEYYLYLVHSKGKDRLGGMSFLPLS